MYVYYVNESGVLCCAKRTVLGDIEELEITTVSCVGDNEDDLYLVTDWQ